MKQKKLYAVCTAIGLAVSTIALPMAAVAALNTDFVRQLADALVSDTAAVDHDYNADSRINAIDLTDAKQDLLSGSQGSGEVATQTIAVTDSTCKHIGRTLASGDTTWLVQSGSAIECTVTGTEAVVTIAGDGCVHSDAKYRPRYAVYVDDALVADVVMGEPEQTIELFSGTTNRTAKVKIIHLSEANNGAVGVKSFTVTSAQSDPIKPTPKKELQIEFVGDSITCAYGVEADSQYVSFETATENFTKSYAYLTAELLDADYSAVSYSGHGVVSGYSNDGAINTDSLVPPYYTQVGSFTEYAADWDFTENPNDVVVVNLGTNDHTYVSKDFDTRGPEFVDAYVDFLTLIREKNPDAVIICTVGTMGCEDIYPYIEEAVAEMGDEKITSFLSATQNMDNGLGADWHPSAYTHELCAYVMADKICTALGLPWSKIGLDMAAGATYDVRIHQDLGANASFYVGYDMSLWVNTVTGGSDPSAIEAYVGGMDLPIGDYELNFTHSAPSGLTVPYAVRETDTGKLLFEGSFTGAGADAVVKETFTLSAASENCELVFFMGGNDSTNVTYKKISLFKRS